MTTAILLRAFMKQDQERLVRGVVASMEQDVALRIAVYQHAAEMDVRSRDDATIVRAVLAELKGEERHQLLATQEEIDLKTQEALGAAGIVFEGADAVSVAQSVRMAWLYNEPDYLIDVPLAIASTCGLDVIAKAKFLQRMARYRKYLRKLRSLPLGDLRPHEIYRIQRAADKLDADVFVVGSAAKGARRNVGTDLPLHEFGTPKAGTRSDIDYAVVTGLDEKAGALGLPDGDATFGVLSVDYINLKSSPAIKFSPGKLPEYIPRGDYAIPLNEAGRNALAKKGIPIAPP
jgi:hypothetical protein